MQWCTTGGIASFPPKTNTRKVIKVFKGEQCENNCTIRLAGPLLYYKTLQACEREGEENTLTFPLTLYKGHYPSPTLLVIATLKLTLHSTPGLSVCVSLCLSWALSLCVCVHADEHMLWGNTYMSCCLFFTVYVCRIHISLRLLMPLLIGWIYMRKPPPHASLSPHKCYCEHMWPHNPVHLSMSMYYPA